MKKISVIQMCSSDCLKTNLNKAKELIGQAADEGTALIVLPEMFPIFGLNANQKVEIAEHEGQGRIQDFLAELAQKHHVWLVGGTIPFQSEEDGKIRAACLVYDERGKVRARYDKIHLFDVTLSSKEKYEESATVFPGNRLSVVDTPVGKLGLAVCYDLRFPEMFRLMFKEGAEIFCVPSAFTHLTGSKHWEVLCRARAIENISFIVGACQGGYHTNKRRTFGNSMIVSPSGDILKRLDDQTVGVISAEIDLEGLCFLTF